MSVPNGIIPGAGEERGATASTSRLPFHPQITELIRVSGMTDHEISAMLGAAWMEMERENRSYEIGQAERAESEGLIDGLLSDLKRIERGPKMPHRVQFPPRVIEVPAPKRENLVIQMWNWIKDHTASFMAAMAFSALILPKVWWLMIIVAVYLVAHVLSGNAMGITRSRQEPIPVDEPRRMPVLDRRWISDRVRVGDVERDMVLAELRAHYSAGRLSTDEHDERSSAVLGATYSYQLLNALEELPKLTDKERRIS